MSIASEITRLQTAKAAIIAAIEEKGVTVPSGATYDDMAELIAQISGGARNIIYKNGVNYSEDAVGGWVSLARNRGADPAASVQTAPTIVSTPSVLSFELRQTSGSVTSGMVHTFESLDVTNARELIVTGDYSVTASASGYRGVRLDVLIPGDTFDNYFDNAVAANCFFSNVGTGLPTAGQFSVAIPVTSITGYHRVAFGLLVQHLGMLINVTGLELV